MTPFVKDNITQPAKKTSFRLSGSQIYTGNNVIISRTKTKQHSWNLSLFHFSGNAENHENGIYSTKLKEVKDPTWKSRSGYYILYGFENDNNKRKNSMTIGKKRNKNEEIKKLQNEEKTGERDASTILGLWTWPPGEYLSLRSYRALHTLHRERGGEEERESSAS